jgi:hypothetical protein
LLLFFLSWGQPQQEPPEGGFRRLPREHHRVIFRWDTFLRVWSKNYCCSYPFNIEKLHFTVKGSEHKNLTSRLLPIFKINGRRASKLTLHPQNPPGCGISHNHNGHNTRQNLGGEAVLHDNDIKGWKLVIADAFWEPWQPDSPLRDGATTCASSIVWLPSSSRARGEWCK